jgi:hypothetical protein
MSAPRPKTPNEGAGKELIPLERAAIYEQLLERQVAARKYKMPLLAAFAGWRWC